MQDPYGRYSWAPQSYGASSVQTNLLNQAFTWMFIGLGITGFVSLFLVTNPPLMNAFYSNSLLFFGSMIVELALVFLLSLGITRMSFGQAIAAFIAYSALNGLTLSGIFLVYTATSIASTFFIAALLFGLMALYGYTTKKDLTSIGNLAFMALIGIIIASLVNLFLRNSMFSLIISYLAVIIFVGLTAYDTQKIKRLSGTTTNQNLGILGALTLYLDFINIFLNLLRILGKVQER